MNVQGLLMPALVVCAFCLAGLSAQAAEQKPAQAAAPEASASAPKAKKKVATNAKAIQTAGRTSAKDKGGTGGQYIAPKKPKCPEDPRACEVLNKSVTP